MDAHTSSSKTTGSAPSPHQAGMDAIDQVLARLELSPEGLILDANPHFLTIMGYPLDELKGKHHGMLLSPDEAKSATYDTFWETLRSDDMIFRYGGEEFCVLLPSISEALVAATVAERLRAALDCMLLINGFVRVPISASLGVAVHPLHGALKPASVLDIADDAAYQAKRDGKNRVVLASVQETSLYAATESPPDVKWQYE